MFFFRGVWVSGCGIGRGNESGVRDRGESGKLDGMIGVE